MLQKHLVRLACIRHAASVHPEPGSNSPQKIFTLASVSLRVYYWIDRVVASYHYSVVKVLVTKQASLYLQEPPWPVKKPTDENTDVF